MFNKHAILALAAISTEALKLEQAIAGGEGTGTPMQELSVDLDMPIAGGEGTGTPMQELSVELAQADDRQWMVDCLGSSWCSPEYFAQVEVESQ